MNTKEKRLGQQGATQLPLILTLLVVVAAILIYKFFIATDEIPPAPAEPEIAQPEPAGPEVTPKPAPPVALKKHATEAKPAYRRLSRDEFSNTEKEAMSYFGKAGEFQRRGDAASAQTWYKKALGSFEKMRGDLEISLATFEEKLGASHKSTLQAKENIAKVNTNVATLYNNIGKTYLDQKKNGEAMSWFQKALSLRENGPSNENADVAALYNNIALTYDNEKEYAKSLEWYQKDLAISEKVQGASHPNTAWTYNNIATVYFHLGDAGHALEWYLKAYRVFADKYGKTSRNTVQVRKSMAAAYAQSANEKSFAEWLNESVQ